MPLRPRQVIVSRSGNLFRLMRGDEGGFDYPPWRGRTLPPRRDGASHRSPASRPDRARRRLFHRFAEDRAVGRSSSFSRMAAARIAWSVDLRRCRHCNGRDQIHQIQRCRSACPLVDRGVDGFVQPFAAFCVSARLRVRSPSETSSLRSHPGPRYFDRRKLGRPKRSDNHPLGMASTLVVSDSRVRRRLRSQRPAGVLLDSHRRDDAATAPWAVVVGYPSG